LSPLFKDKNICRKKNNFIINISVTNEIPEYPSHTVQPTNILDHSVCIICEFAVEYIYKVIANNTTRDWIKKVVHGVCNHLPKTVANYCNEFVDDYADTIINTLSELVSSPKKTCTVLSLCKKSIVQIRGTVLKVIITF